jgi:hypothetical protein
MQPLLKFYCYPSSIEPAAGQPAWKVVEDWWTSSTLQQHLQWLPGRSLPAYCVRLGIHARSLLIASFFFLRPSPFWRHSLMEKKVSVRWESRGTPTSMHLYEWTRRVIASINSSRCMDWQHRQSSVQIQWSPGSWSLHQWVLLLSHLRVHCIESKVRSIVVYTVHAHYYLLLYTHISVYIRITLDLC